MTSDEFWRALGSWGQYIGDGQGGVLFCLTSKQTAGSLVSGEMWSLEQSPSWRELLIHLLGTGYLEVVNYGNEVLSFAFLSFCIFKGRVLLYSSGWP
jgi:hypothetical protein